MKQKVYTTIEVAAKAFAKQRQSKSTILSLDFDSLYAEFSNDCKTFESIAKSQSVTRERVRQLYMKYFNRIIPRRPDGRTRRKICTLKKRILNKAISLQKQFFNNPAASALKSAVESLGFGVNVISVSPHFFSVGGKQCTFSFCNKVQKFGLKKEKLYWLFRLNPRVLKRSELIFLVLIDGEEFRFFIIPVHELPARFFEAFRPLYIPQGGFNPKGRGRKSDFSNVLKYENAWYYLGKRERPESQKEAV